MQLTMLVSHSSDELPYRRVWLESREFEDDLKAYAANGLDDELRAASNAAFAMAYYKQPVRKGWASLILSFWLPTVLHITGTCTSDVFIKSVQQRDVAPLILLVLGMYQREDNHKPGVGVKFLHGLGSLVVTGLNAALAAYILGTARGKPDLRAAISSIVMAIVSLYASAGSFLLLLKGVAGNLAEATWADYFDLNILLKNSGNVLLLLPPPAPPPPPPPPPPPFLPPPAPPAIAPPVSYSSSASSVSGSGATFRRSNRQRKQTEFYGRSSPGPAAKMT
ncbi:predicted protein [Histoplasma capsulatum var. duboisii H88]|uniref:Predicted protein n=1 Tax=Ajellomyces capsulatus (strain H88) TaxID=544711 RepID=F0USG7_AJEC8|nr:predicted protein [Histoplasma capsulatum var. duboisii H88]